jgi:hypothetical protein
LGPALALDAGIGEVVISAATYSIAIPERISRSELEALALCLVLGAIIIIECVRELALLRWIYCSVPAVVLGSVLARAVIQAHVYRVWILVIAVTVRIALGSADAWDAILMLSRRVARD